MGQRTLARYLTEEQRNKGIITADLKFLIEIVSRACQAISIAIGKGSASEAFSCQRAGAQYELCGGAGADQSRKPRHRGAGGADAGLV